MTAVGIDIGTSKVTVGAVVNRAIETVLNDLSNRSTPACVGFTPKCRLLGEASKTQEVGNLKNTVASIKRLIGLTYEEAIAQEAKFVTAPIVNVNGAAMLQVDYLGQSTLFSPVQLMGMLLTSIRANASRELQMDVVDCALSVPAYFTEVQRRLLLDAATIAGLRPFKLTNESTAIAIEYGIYRESEMSESVARNVVFVDVGHSATTVTVASFLKGKFEIKGLACDSLFGGRDLDWEFFEFFARELQQSHGLDVKSNKKACLRLLSACERAKKTLSANPVINFSVECLMNDVDVCKMINRSDFEAVCGHLVSRLEAPIAAALKMSGLAAADIHVVELVGGSVRVPIIKRKISDIFNGKELSMTLNLDEACSRGCTMQCAILSPTIRVKMFSFKEFNTIPIKCCYEGTAENPNDCQSLLFPLGCHFPAAKDLTLKRPSPVEIAVCTESAEAGDGSATLTPIAKVNCGVSGKIKTRIRLNQHCFVAVDSATLVEESVIEEKDADGNVVEKKVATTKEIPFSLTLQHPFALTEVQLADFAKKEETMKSNDAAVVEIADLKNAVEQFVYGMRSRFGCGGDLNDFAQVAEKTAFEAALENAESWLYGDGEDTTKEAYAARLASLEAAAKPFLTRFAFKATLVAAHEQFCQMAHEALAKLASAELAHLTPAEMAQVTDAINSKTTQIEQAYAKQMALPAWSKPVFSGAEIDAIRSALFNAISPVLRKPKPVVTTADAETKAQTSTAAEEDVEPMAD